MGANMNFSEDIKGCKVFVHAEENENIVCDSKITEYDRSKITVQLEDSLNEFRENDKVFLLIVKKDAILEFRGTVRKVNSRGSREIALFKGRAKEDRESARYNVNVPAEVEAILIEGRVTTLTPPVDVTITNISTTGISMRTGANIFNVKTRFLIKLNLGESETAFRTCVKRRKAVEDNIYEYGCALEARESL